MKDRLSQILLILAIAFLGCNAPERMQDLSAVRSLIEAMQYDSALVELDRVLKNGSTTPMRLVLDQDIDQLIEHPEYRPKVRTLVKTYAREASAIMKGEEEPGERIKVHGIISDERTNQPLEEVSVELVQADAQGKYFEEESLWNPRLFAYLKTKETGEFLIETILPGNYQDDEGEWVPAHIHFTLEKEGYRTYASEFSFETDSVLLKRGNTDTVPIAKHLKDFEYEVFIRMQQIE